MKYVRTKEKVYEVVEENERYYKCCYDDGSITLVAKFDNDVNGFSKALKTADSIEELCDCFIIKYVESHYYSVYYTYEDAKYVYDHDKQNTTCILYGVIDTETALNYVAIETDGKGLILNEK